MDKVGFALSVVQLINVFQSCLDLYDHTKTWQGKDSDILYISVKLDFEKKRSAKILQLLSQQPDSQARVETISESSYRLINGLGRSKVQTLTEIEHMMNKHVDTNIGGKAITYVTWSTHEKSRLQELITRLKELNDDLTTLIPRPAQVGMAFNVMTEAISTSNQDNLHQLHQGLGLQYQAIRSAARLKSLRISASSGLEVCN
jgi:hypothetical protein